MDEKNENCDDDQITFTLGKGNQSAICGGVAPMVVDGLQNDMNAHPTDAENSVGSKGEIRPDADTKVQLP